MFVTPTEVSPTKELSFLSAFTRLAIHDMDCIVRRDIAKSKPSQNIKAIRARQAHYIQWCIKKGFKDPVGQEKAWEQVIAIYIKCVDRS